AAPAKRARPLPRTCWERGQGRRVPQTAARLLHRLAHCSGGPLQRPSSSPPLQSATSPQAFTPSYALWLMMGAANRDPTQFREPDRLDVRREDVRHLSFAMGPHYCVGAALARMEAQEVFGALIRRFPRLRLEGGPALH
ncbi:cytochrome P450, partial [Archangium sp.]|uniref:cytochrome P450 n=1 Tax=Archangium sp. TaxID=1872627 RepID=UPI002D4EB3DF